MVRSKKKLVIISHTEHYRDQSGSIRGWGSTVNEINYLADYWEEVVHIACLHSGNVATGLLPYTKRNISFAPIPPFGGKSWNSKIYIFFLIPRIVWQIIIALKGATEVQLRLPTSMGLFLLPLFSFVFPRRYTFWVKYAGNWAHEDPPLSYRIQRWWLKRNFTKCYVTINGCWKGQPAHCLSFENPCLNEEELEKHSIAVSNKKFQIPFTICFVGRLDKGKGVHILIEAVQALLTQNIIGEVHIVGDGPEGTTLKMQSKSIESGCIIFHGALERHAVFEIVKQSHFLILPSASEGFPKVIPEAWSLRCIPIVTDVSAIGQYVKHGVTGFLIPPDKRNAGSIEQIFIDIKVGKYNLDEVAWTGQGQAAIYTYSNYKNKILNEIVND